VLIGSSVRAIPIAESAQRDLAYYSQPELWHNHKFFSRDTPIESLFKMLDEFQFALFVALPEDITSKGGTEYLTIRDNVLFEMGLFLGRLGRERVFLIAPRGSGKAKPQLPSDLTGIQPSYYDADAVNLPSAIATSLFELKEALRAFDAQFLIFDARHNLRSEQLVNKGGKRHDPLGNPVSDVGTASFKLTNDSLEIRRTNAEGVWQVEIRPNGRLTPTVAKRPGLDRTLRVDFEAKITGTEHIVRCVSVNASNWDWIDSRHFPVTESEWRSFRAELNAPLNLDVLVRLQDELERPPDGILHLRNIAVRQLEP
jgi:hypothetical protein